MKKIIAVAAIAGLGAAFAVSAQAQSIGTVTGSTPGSYVINVAESSTGPVGGTYTYSYALTLNTAASQANVNVFNLAFGFPTAGEYNVGSESGTGAFTGLGVGDSDSATGFSLTAAGSGGLNASTPTTVITYTSSLPPTGVVGITPTADGITTGAGNGSNFTGPGTAVPEVSSFALIGLGLLPLGLIARRRIMK